MAATESIGWEHDGVPLGGYVARPAGPGPFPAAIAFPGATGGERRLRMTVEGLVVRGYAAAAVGMYDTRLDTAEEMAAGGAFQELLDRPALLRERARGWFDRFAALPGIDPARVATLGYCFGGLCVLEIARSGADAKATIAYHGLLQTHAPAVAGTVRGHVAAYCAGRDPYVPAGDIDGFAREMTQAGIAHQITVFSEAQHAFTDPDAAAHARAGIAFDPVAEAVSWAGTLALLERCLQ